MRYLASLRESLGASLRASLRILERARGHIPTRVAVRVAAAAVRVPGRVPGRRPAAVQLERAHGRRPRLVRLELERVRVPGRPPCATSTHTSTRRDAPGRAAHPVDATRDQRPAPAAAALEPQTDQHGTTDRTDQLEQTRPARDQRTGPYLSNVCSIPADPNSCSTDTPHRSRSNSRSTTGTTRDTVRHRTDTDRHRTTSR